MEPAPADAVVGVDRGIHMRKEINQILIAVVIFSFILIVLNIYALSQLTDKANSALDLFQGYPASLIGTSALQETQQSDTTFSIVIGHVNAAVMANLC